MNILIVDDHLLFLEGMALYFSGQSFDVFSATDLTSAIEILDSGIDLDVALVDIDLSGSSGIEIIEYIKHNKLLIPVVVMSANEKASTISECLDAGASGYIPKTSSTAVMAEAISSVLSGVTFIPDDYRKAVCLHEQKVARFSEMHGVGARQLDVLRYMDMGLSNKEIGARLFISEATVKSHIMILFKALNAKNRVDCLKLAKEEEFIN